jgi:hypothetical protein
VTSLTATVVISRLITATEGAVLGDTLWIVQLTLLTLLAWIFAEFRRGALRWQFDRYDAGVTLLVLGEGLSALWNWSLADRRAMLNMLWEWAGLLVTWFLLRRLARRAAARQQLVTAFLALGVTLSGMGIWQHYAGFAEMRNEVVRLQKEWDSLQSEGRPVDPREAREWDQKVQRLRAEFVRMRIPTDDGARMLWDQRVNASSEPIGTFALANTFAGVLLAAVLIGAGIVLHERWATTEWSLWKRGVTVLVCGAIVFCLILTKSRTAYVGFLAGLIAGLGAMRFRANATRRHWLWGGGALAGLGLAVVVAGLTGGLDRLVLFESFKSLKYRSEYWLGSWHMLSDEPLRLLFGVGSGNFRSNYLQFKLPESSEEIADPHNMVLDVWSSGGIIGLAGLCLLCATGISLLGHRDSNEVGSDATAITDERSSSFLRAGVIPGALLAFGATWLIGGSFDDRLLPLAFGWGTMLALARGLGWGVPRLVWYGAAFLGLAIHLLGAGGIAMPAITQTLLFLIAIGTSSPSAGEWKGKIESRIGWIAVGAGAIGLYLLCWFTALIPVMNARADLAVGDQALFEEGRPEKALRAYKRAAEADPLSGEACERLAQLNLQLWLASKDSGNEQFDQSVYWQRLAIVRDPGNYGGYRALGAAYLTRFDRTRDPEDATLAADEFSRAQALYPNHAELLSELAEASWHAGQADGARAFASRSLELNEINQAAGHVDKVLSPDRRKILDRILAPETEVPSLEDEPERSEVSGRSD